MRCWIGASRLPSASAAELSALMANRSRNEPTAGSVNVARSRCWPRSDCAPPALPRPVWAARSAPDSAYLLTQAPQSLPHLPISRHKTFAFFARRPPDTNNVHGAGPAFFFIFHSRLRLLLFLVVSHLTPGHGGLLFRSGDRDSTSTAELKF